MDIVSHICKKHNLFFDRGLCTQAHFAKWKGQNVGTFGNAGTFSFFPGKNLGAYGDAGAIVTNDDELAKKMRMFSNHGALKKHAHEIEGINSRLDGIQAAILSIKLPHIRKWTNQRIENAKLYTDLLSNIDGIVTPKVDKHAKHVYHLYVIRVRNRSDTIKVLKDNGIQTGIHCPTPLPFLKAYRNFKAKPSDFPISYKYMDEILSLPMFPELTKTDLSTVCSIFEEPVLKIVYLHQYFKTPLMNGAPTPMMWLLC